MRTKRVTMALLAFAIAISGAFASMVPFPKMAWVQVIVLNNAIVCLPTQYTCSNIGEVACYVNVNTLYGSRTTLARGINSCNMVLSEVSSSPIGTYNPVMYQVIDVVE
jgi:hypothetical protein